VTLQEVAIGAQWRKDFMFILMGILKETSTNDGIMAYFDSLDKWDQAGMFDFSFLTC